MRIESRRAPMLALSGGALLIALGAGLIAAHVTAFALDETLIQQSAVHYTSDFPHSLFHDLDARATDRLYSLVLSIAFRLFSGASAVRVDHVLSVALFVSTVIPIYLMARIVLESAWSAVAVALLSVAVPWLTLTSALFTENLSYPLFWWMVLATCAAVWRPSPARDLVALATIALLVCTRAQFAAVYFGYLLALLAVAVWRADGASGVPRRVARAAASAVRTYPLTLVVLAGIVALVLYEKASGQWQAHVEQLLGTYSNVIIRNGLPPNMGEGLLIELIALALGVGLLPAIVSLVWFAKRMARPQPDRRWVYLFASGVVLVVFLILTVYSQGGYLGPITEERYFFYVIPAFWLGTFAALQDRDVRPGELLACALAVATLYASIPFQSPLTQETDFLAPVESVVPHILERRLSEVGLTGLSIQDALALFALLVGIATAILWRRRTGRRLWWPVAIAAVLQLLLTGYAYAVIDGKIDGIVGRTSGSVAPLGWVDSHARSASVAWLDDLSTAAPLTSDASPSEDQTRTTLFWNKRLLTWAEVPALGLPSVEVPLAALPGLPGMSVAPTSGLLQPAAEATHLDEVVQATNSAFLQLAGTSLARSPDGVLTLTQLSRPVHATWLATGLQGNGTIPATTPVRLSAFAAKSSAVQELDVTLILAPASPQAAPTVLSLRLGASRQRIVLRGGAMPQQATLLACFPPGSTVVTGSMAVARPVAVGGAGIGGVVERVALSAPRASVQHCA